MSGFRPISSEHLVVQTSNLAYVHPELIPRLSIYNLSYFQSKFVSKLVTDKQKTKNKQTKNIAILLLIPTRESQSIGRMSIGRISIGRKSIGRRSIGRMWIDHLSGWIVNRGLIRSRILYDARYLLWRHRPIKVANWHFSSGFLGVKMKSAWKMDDSFRIDNFVYFPNI